jgi:hypothetical protein
VRLIAANAGEPTAVQLNFDTAVALAQDAGGLMPLHVHDGHHTMTIVIAESVTPDD